MDPNYEPPSMALRPELHNPELAAMSYAVREERRRLLDEFQNVLETHHDDYKRALDAYKRQSALDDPRELRAFCVKIALESRSWWDAKVADTDEAVDAIFAVAKRFEDYISGSDE